MPGGGGSSGGGRGRQFAAARAVDRGRRGGGPTRQSNPIAGGLASQVRVRGEGGQPFRRLEVEPDAALELARRAVVREARARASRSPRTRAEQAARDRAERQARRTRIVRAEGGGFRLARPQRGGARARVRGFTQQRERVQRELLGQIAGRGTVRVRRG